MLLLDAITDGVELIKLTAQLPANLIAYKEAQGKNDFLGLVSIAKKISEILAKLGIGADDPKGEVTTTADDELSDDTNSPNYRYKDTGYIADSRKEKAASMIGQAKKGGYSVRATDVDWDAIEQNPRQAAELITKNNLFGKTDWQKLQDSGMNPAAGFLVSKVYASIAPEPSEATPVARKDYAIGLESIRERLEKVQTVDEVLAVLSEIRGEINGVQLSAEQADEVARLRSIWQEKDALAKEKEAEKDAVYQSWNRAQMEFNSLKYEQDKRARRKWKPDAEAMERLTELSKISDEANKAYTKYLADHPELKSEKRDVGNGYVSYKNELEWDAYQYSIKIREITNAAKAFNLATNQATRSWLTLGERFLKLIHYRTYSGSDSFAGHVTNAKTGKVTDWGWSNKERGEKQPKTATGNEINFQLRVADRFDRVGGKDVSVNSTKELKDQFGFRDVQSGNWVLKDPNSAKFHVEQTAAAMSDLSDMLGINMNLLGFGGRLGMAFGARGTGGKDAARAHYEPVHRVINLTKMGGGGALAHEYFHSLDNVMRELLTEETGKKDHFSSLNPESLPDGAIKEAMTKLKLSMLTGDVRSKETISYAASDIRTAKHNMDGGYTYLAGPAKSIKAAGNALDAVLAVTRIYEGRNDKRSNKQFAAWKRLAVAYYHQGDAPEGMVSVDLPTGPAGSSFLNEAHALDGGSKKKYWSGSEEMAARAFQSYIEDKMESAERKNDYLSVYADNKYHVDPLFGIEWKPYPEGEERTKINAAFESLFDAIRSNQMFEKANGNKALMDAIFGIQEQAEPEFSDETENRFSAKVLVGTFDDVSKARAIRSRILDKVTPEQAGILAGTFDSAEFWINNAEHEDIGGAAEKALAMAKEAGDLARKANQALDSVARESFTTERNKLIERCNLLFK